MGGAPPYLPLQLIGRLLALGDVADHAVTQQTLLSLQGAQADLDREFGAVAVARDQVEADSHGAGMRFGDIRRAMLSMACTQAFGQQHLDWLADQFDAIVAKHALVLSVVQHHLTFRINPYTPP